MAASDLKEKFDTFGNRLIIKDAIIRSFSYRQLDEEIDTTLVSVPKQEATANNQLIQLSTKAQKRNTSWPGCVQRTKAINQYV